MAPVDSRAAELQVIIIGWGRDEKRIAARQAAAPAAHPAAQVGPIVEVQVEVLEGRSADALDAGCVAADDIVHRAHSAGVDGNGRDRVARLVGEGVKEQLPRGDSLADDDRRAVRAEHCVRRHVAREQRVFDVQWAGIERQEGNSAAAQRAGAIVHERRAFDRQGPTHVHGAAAANVAQGYTVQADGTVVAERGRLDGGASGEEGSSARPAVVPEA